MELLKDKLGKKSIFKEVIKANSVIQFDVIIPEANADFTGAITCGSTLQDKNWKDKGKGVFLLQKDQIGLL